MGNSKLMLPVGFLSATNAGRNRGPLGYLDAADPNRNQCLKGDTPSSLGVNDYATPLEASKSSGRECSILLFDMSCIARFIRSVALAKAQQLATSVQWKSYDEDQLINFVYALMPWKGKPGTVEIVQGAIADIEKAAEADTDKMLSNFLKKCAESPAAAVTYLEQLGKLREGAMASTTDIFNTVAKLNMEIQQETERGIKWLSGIKCGSELILIGTGLGTGKLAVAGVWIGYSMIKEWSKAKNADVIGVGLTETGEEVAGKVGEKGGAIASSNLVPNELQKMDKWDAEAKILQKKDLIDKYSIELDRRIASGHHGRKTKELQNKIRNRTVEIKQLEKAASNTRRIGAQAVKIAGRSVSFVFAAKDAYESIGELVKTWKAAE